MERTMLTICEITDIQKAIAEIDRILNTIPFRANEARSKIFEINTKHPDNLYAYGLIFCSSNSGVTTIEEANYAQLKADMQWKRYYLYEKQLGKTVDEIIKEFKKSGENQHDKTEI